MKRIFTLTLVIIGLFVNAQNQAAGDTIESAFINFEEVAEYIQIPEFANNLWQISEPNKINFNSAFSPIHAIITDNLNNYSINNHSYFDFYVSGNLIIGGLPQMQVQFKHKFDTDTLLDGGYISISYDNGSTWKNVIDDDAAFFETTPLEGYYNIDMYSQENVLFNGEKGFSGNSGSWRTSQISWITFPLKTVQDTNFGPIILRFNFISDDIDNDKEGWIIDDIRMFYVDLGGSIDEKQNTTFEMSPNPANDFLTVKLSENQQSEQSEVEIYNLSGQLVKVELIQSTEQLISLENIKQGLYIIKIGEQKQRLIIE